MPLPVLFPSQEDHDTQRPYRLYDYTESQILQPPLSLQRGRESQYSADTLYLVIESVKRETQHQPDSNALAPADRAGGRPL